MKKLVLKNSLFVALLALMTFFVLMPLQSHAYADQAGVVQGSSLSEYEYSFSVDPAAYSGPQEYQGYSVYVRAFTEVTTSGTTNEVILDDAVVTSEGVATIDFRDAVEAFFADGASIVTCSVDLNMYGVDFMDYIVFNNIAVSETVESAAAEDTTFEYGIDTVMTPNVGDVDLSIISEGTDDIALYALDYLENKTDLIANNDDAKNTFVWVNNKLVLTKGSTQASGSIVLAALASNLVKTAGFETGEPITLGTLLGDKAKLQTLITLLPLGINIKETAITVKNGASVQYTPSSQQYGITLTPFADYFTGNTNENLSELMDIFFPAGSIWKKADTASGLAAVFQYLEDAGILDGKTINLSNCFSIISFKGETPQEFITGFNTMFNGLINKAVDAVNALTFGKETTKLLDKYMKFAGTDDVAETLIWWYINQHKTIKGHDIKGVPATITKALKELADDFAFEAAAYVDAFAADSATKLAVVDEMAFYHGINTGDSNNFVVWTVMFVMAVLGLAGAALKRN